MFISECSLIFHRSDLCTDYVFIICIRVEVINFDSYTNKSLNLACLFVCSDDK